MFGLTPTLCVQLLNNTAGCRTSGLKLAWLWWTGIILRLGTNGRIMWKLHEPPATNPSRTSYIPGHLLPQGPRGFNPCFPATGWSATSPTTALKWTAPSGYTHWQDTDNCREWPSHHSFNRQGETCISPHGHPPRHQQPTGPAQQRSITISITANGTTQDHPFRPDSLLPCPFSAVVPLSAGGYCGDTHVSHMN